MSFTENIKNFARTTLVTPGVLAGTGTSGTFVVASGAGAKFPATNFFVSVEEEIIWITSQSADTFTIGGRGQQGTTAVAHPAGSPVIHGALAHHIYAIQDPVARLMEL